MVAVGCLEGRAGCHPAGRPLVAHCHQSGPTTTGPSEVLAPVLSVFSASSGRPEERDDERTTRGRHVVARSSRWKSVQERIERRRKPTAVKPKKMYSRPQSTPETAAGPLRPLTNSSTTTAPR